MAFILVQSYRRQLRWEAVQGTILKSVAERCEDGLFRPDIRFSYTVNRRRYNDGKYRDDFVHVCYEKVEVDAILSQYPHGAVVDAWYDPRNPSLAVLDRSLGSVHYGLMIVMCCVVVACAFVLFSIRRHRARHAST